MKQQVCCCLGMNPQGQYTLLCVDMDLKRLLNLVTQIRFMGLSGLVICFDFQAEGIKEFCGETVELATVNFEAVYNKYRKL